jgi:hypothetical protein
MGCISYLVSDKNRDEARHQVCACCAVQMPESDELLWDDGTAQPEWCLDQFPLVGKV